MLLGAPQAEARARAACDWFFVPAAEPERDAEAALRAALDKGASLAKRRAQVEQLTIALRARLLAGVADDAVVLDRTKAIAERIAEELIDQGYDASLYLAGAGRRGRRSWIVELRRFPRDDASGARLAELSEQTGATFVVKPLDQIEAPEASGSYRLSANELALPMESVFDGNLATSVDAIHEIDHLKLGAALRAGQPSPYYVVAESVAAPGTQRAAISSVPGYEYHFDFGEIYAWQGSEREKAKGTPHVRPFGAGRPQPGNLAVRKVRLMALEARRLAHDARQSLGRGDVRYAWDAAVGQPYAECPVRAGNGRAAGTIRFYLVGAGPGPALDRSLDPMFSAYLGDVEAMAENALGLARPAKSRFFIGADRLLAAE
jgi:hypothetical protein